MENQRYAPGDPILIGNIVSYLKAKGLFDEFRHECLADVDTKSSYQNMSQRVDGYTTKFLTGEAFNSDLSKNDLRNKLRKNIDESGMLGLGSEHVVDQVVNPKIGQLFLPRIIEVVHQYVNEEDENSLNVTRNNENLEKSLQINEISSTTESNDGNSAKAKTPVLDPIADILSFTYSKPKPIPQSAVQKSEFSHKKGNEASPKVDRRKEDVNPSAKPNETLPKLDKKEEVAQPVKSDQVIEKIFDPAQVNVLDSSVISEETSANTEVKLDITESDDDETEVKLEAEIKLKKELKNEEIDLPSDTAKKPLKEEVKVEKKKTEDTKSNESINSSENNKINIASKSSGHSKPKLEQEKSKKIKMLSSQKSPTSAPDQRKPNFKETSDTNLQSDKTAKTASSKSLKSSKLLPSKSNLSKPVKKEKSEEDSIKLKPIDSQSSKSSSSLLKKSSKTISSKGEQVSKVRPDKYEKEKHPKSQTSKPKEILPASPANADKVSQVMPQSSSSSYDSSQSSDFDKSQQVTSEEQKKHKHYSKHNKKDDSAEKSSLKDSRKPSDSKPSHKMADEAVKKHKHENSSKLSFKNKLKEDMVLQDATKTGSRSNSLSSSTSSSMSKDTQSDDSCENPSKQSEKKKKPEKERCSTPQNIPPPPPPSPPPADAVATESTSSSPDDTTQESGTMSSDDESHSEGESSEGSSSDSDDDSDSNTQASDHDSVGESAELSEIYDSFLYSSSSSEFEGFCSSPERNKEPSSDLSVSSVHTSDLSSYEDEISVEDLSSEDGPQSPHKKVKRKITLKEAQELLRRKEAKKRSESIKDVPYEGTLMEEKSSEIALPSSISILTSEEEVSPRQEPRRELRRERKLNPKYASNEYTSIFNSKRTSFITKQMNLSPHKSPSSVSPVSSTSTNELTDVKSKEKSASNKMSAAVERTNNISTSNNLPSSTFDETNSNSPRKAGRKRTFEAESVDDSNCNENDLESSPIKLSLNIKSPSIKAKIAKDLNPNGMKRKFDGSDKMENKRLCIRNSIDRDSLKRDVHEDKTFNNQNIKKRVLSSNNLHKQKANGDVLKKKDHLRKRSQSKPNCAVDKNK